MSQIESVTPAMAPIIYRNVPCISTEQLAKAYEVESVLLRNNFSNNKNRFTEGKHFFQIDGKELTDLRNLQVKNLYLQISPKTRHITLWTERGAARHAKMLNSDKAWDMFELLEESFFRTAEHTTSASNPVPTVPVQSADAPITPDQQCTLQAIAKQRITAINDKFNGKGGALYPKLWSKFNNHFRLAKYSQLPQSRMTEAIQYLMTVSLDDKQDKRLALPMQTQSNLALQAAQLHSRFIVLHSHVYEEMRSITKAMESLYRELYPELNKETLDANAVKKQDHALQALTDSFLHKANFALTFPDDRMGECIDPFFQLERMIAG